MNPTPFAWSMMAYARRPIAVMPIECPILDFRTPVFHPGRNLTVRRGQRWHGVAETRLDLGHGALSAPLALQELLNVPDPFLALHSTQPCGGTGHRA